MRTLAIAGVGLIGGSFSLALRRAGFDGRILGVSSPRTIEEALRLGAIDEGVSLEQAVARADLLLLAQPIARILSLLDEIAPQLHPGLLVTDAGSTKARIAQRTESWPAGSFLGGHPMAGKEARGVAAADPDLFQGRTWVLTPRHPEDLERPAVQDLRQWIERIGSRILVLSPPEHDAVVAFTSHLPQMASTAIARTVENGLARDEHLLAAGPGLVDMTRLAMSSYDIWQDILETNPGPVAAALDRYLEVLSSLRDRLLDASMAGEFERAGAFARKLRSGSAVHRGQSQ